MGECPHEVHFQKEEIMKTRVLFIAVSLLAATLFATSCSKADFLKGTTWHCDKEDWEGDLVFINKMECRIVFDSGINLGDYSVDMSKISIRIYNVGEVKGTIKGNTMTCSPSWDDVSLTFKKKK